MRITLMQRINADIVSGWFEFTRLILHKARRGDIIVEWMIYVPRFELRRGDI